MPQKSVLRNSDVGRLGLGGLVARPTRAILSALGIALGIAAMIAVVGISNSSQAKLAATLDSLGTNLLTASQGEDLFGSKRDLPPTSAASAARVTGVQAAASTGELKSARISRSSAGRGVDGLTVLAASPELVSVLGAEMAAGSWLTAGTAQYPVAVLGSEAARRLGVVQPGRHIMVDDTLHTVAGLLNPVQLEPRIDSAVLIGEKAAASVVGATVPPTSIYVRADERLIAQVRDALPRTVHPKSPQQVSVARPSDALTAKQATDQAFNGMLLGLGSVALLVGGIGVANTMVISVLERRKEIGLRRSLGAARAHIRRQFLAEALLLSLLGGLTGVVIGIIVTGIFATIQGLPLVVPPAVMAGGLGATLAIGALAGLYPAVRAARISPTEALHS
ncbi:ABC transporter permease [Leifsonia aquatica]|uniref:ABC transporter permease n=1 Tax=Leifsonia aquatica TaxID=144185 RepID=UPI003801353E